MGKKLRTIRIVDRWGELDQKDILELKKHIFHVEYVLESVQSTVNSDAED